VDLNQLKTFVTVAEEQHLRERLNVYLPVSLPLVRN
jgi:hypothetical protein